MTYEEEIERKANALNEQERQVEIELRRKIAFKNVIDAPDGRRVLKTILNMCPNEYDCFSSDALLMSYRCGRRSVISELRDFIKCHFGNDSLNIIEKEEL